MTLIITPFYAALVALFYILLSKQVVNNRWNFINGLGSAEGYFEKSALFH